uniref:Peptidase S1 domain-containing protein n=1 Tax=Ascaris lumbricoides TaxID=6252 RepID=A0A0M3HNB5_ASCLU
MFLGGECFLAISRSLSSSIRPDVIDSDDLPTSAPERAMDVVVNGTQVRRCSSQLVNGVCIRNCYLSAGVISFVRTTAICSDIKSINHHFLINSTINIAQFERQHHIMGNETLIMYAQW